MHLVGDGEETLEHFHEDIPGGIDVFVPLVPEHLDAGIDEEKSE